MRPEVSDPIHNNPLLISILVHINPNLHFNIPPSVSKLLQKSAADPYPGPHKSNPEL
jgi:hypothetical protein